ncbi:MFS transporter [Nocardioides sp. DS6]|uniref:MFS transporter n=1 Tax=Nocardioides eburneus TaxID=3231482 RepID=A0ABV3T002_9ACTN
MSVSVPSAPSARASARRAVLCSFVGTAIEWYDFFIYGTAAALALGPLFFPSSSSAAGTLLAFATYAIGFAARPIGGIVMGHFGDRIGRKSMLIVSMLLMGLSTVAVGCLPTYAAIGAWAPLLLVACRFVQGLGVGGEWGGAVLMATEYAPKGKRGLYGVAPQLGVPVGVLVANVTFLVITRATSDAQFLSWGWRLPFLLSFVLVGIAFWIRLGVMESPEFRAVAAKHEVRTVPIVEVLTTGWHKVLLAAGSFIATNGVANVFMVFLLSYGTGTLGHSRDTMLFLLIASVPAWMLGMALSAHYSDRLGRRTVYVGAAVGLLVVSAVFFLMIDTGSIPVMVVAEELMAFFLGLTVGPQSAVFAELFPAAIRFSGASLAYQVGAILGGGLAPIIATALFDRFHNSASVTGYCVAASVVSLLCSAVLLRRDHVAAEEPAQTETVVPSPLGGVA